MPSKRDMEQWAIEQFGTTPIDYMMGVLSNPANTDDERMDAAKAAAPYIHPRLRQIEQIERPPERTEKEITNDIVEILAQYAPGGATRDLIGPPPGAAPQPEHEPD